MYSHQWPKSIEGNVGGQSFVRVFFFVPAGLVKLQVFIISLYYKYAHRSHAMVWTLLENTNFIRMFVK